jgi:glycosyltransferase involved in cell wall biosynthesis
MRIALAATGGFDESGREKVIPSLLWLIERIARRHELHVYALRYLSSSRSYPLLGAVVHDLGRPEGFRAQQRALHGALQADGPFDVVHAYWGLPAGLHSAIAARRLGIPSIVTLDSGELVSIPEAEYGLQRGWRQHLGVRAACRLATHVTVCTEYYRNLAEKKGLAADVIPLGVDTAAFTAPARRDEGPPWRLIHVASLNAVKNQSLLLRAARALIDRGVDAHLDIVGEDTLHGALPALVREIGIERRVTFHGFRPSEELIPLYQRAHAAVLTSHHEAAGVVTLEAAACGVPTVGTNVGYVADWAPDRAVAVPSASAGQLAEAIEALLLDRPRRERIGAAARTWAVAHNADRTAEAFEALYKSVWARGARA